MVGVTTWDKPDELQSDDVISIFLKKINRVRNLRTAESGCGFPMKRRALFPAQSRAKANRLLAKVHNTLISDLFFGELNSLFLAQYGQTVTLPGNTKVQGFTRLAKQPDFS